jgi:hypothetical protein
MAPNVQAETRDIQGGREYAGDRGAKLGGRQFMIYGVASLRMLPQCGIHFAKSAMSHTRAAVLVGTSSSLDWRAKIRSSWTK